MRKFKNIIFNNCYFCILYIFTSFSFITVLKIIPKINILPTFAILWGIIISLKNLYTIFRRKTYSIEWFVILLLFTTLLLNLFAYPNIENIKTWITNLILLTSIFFIDKENSKVTIEKQLFVISNFYIGLTFIFSSISLVLLILNIDLSSLNFTTAGKGGFFQNENSLGISAAISIVITLYLIFTTTSKKLKSIYAVNLFIQLYLVLISPARSAFFIFVALLGIFILIKLRKPFLRILYLVVPFLSTIYICTFSDDILNRITTNRDAIWSSASILIKNNFLLGVGYHDLVGDVLEARSVYIPEGIATGRLHNIFIEVFATNGIFAFMTLIVFILINLFCIFKRITTLKSKEDIRLYLLFSLIVSILMINLFESNLLYITSFISIIFWTYLGYTLSIIDAKKRDE